MLSALIAADADMVWTTVSPSVLAGLVGGANAEGYLPMWSGNVPSFSYLLLGSAVGPLLDTNYIVSNYIVTWNTEGVAGLDEMKDWMGKHNPELPISDSYIIGWTEAMAAHQVIERAAADGDLTRAGVIAAFNKVTVDYKGLAPNQSWGGDANDNVIRETYSYDVVLADYDAGATIADGGGTGTVLLRGPWASDITKAQVYDGACFKSGS